MDISDERIDELMEQMLSNVDDDGWCPMPDNLSEEEQTALSMRITIVTMQDRIDSLMEGILNVFKYSEELKDEIKNYDTVEKIKVKSALGTIKEDAQSLLMDLHSDDRVSDFFKIDFIFSDEDGEEGTEEEINEARVEMEEVIERDFKDQLDKIVEYCIAIIEMSDDIVGIVDGE